MLRQIYTVNAIQIVTSESHPEGIKSAISGYPVDYDSRSYEATAENPNGNPEIALICAKADFQDRVKQLATAKNPNRVMWCVTIEQADGRQIMREKWGNMPDMTPAPEPEPEPEEPAEE